MGSVAAAVRHDVGVDPTHYPIRDDMGEGSLQRLISELLRPLLARVLRELGVEAFVGADQFIYYRQFSPTHVVAPDVYVMPGFSPDIEVDCWKTWETGVAPSFALEVVSRDHRKDAERSPVRYAELGAKELVIFDPKHQRRRGSVQWLVYRSLPRRGLVHVEATNEDRIYSKSLRLWLRAVGEGPQTRLRLAKGPRGDELIPTDVELASAARAAADEARRAREEERRARVEERRARVEAEAEVARLRAELSKLKKRR